MSLCKYKKWVVKESVLLRRREGDDMLTHPHNKVSKLHSKEPHQQPFFVGFSDVFFQYLFTGFSILLGDFMSKTLGALHLGFRF